MTPRERIFETIKEEMIKNIKSASLKSIDIVDALNQELFGYAHYLNEMPNYLEPTESVTINTDETEPKTNIEPRHSETENMESDANIIPVDNSDQQTEMKVNPSDDSKDSSKPANIGILKRGLANGRIETQDGRSIFIPESIIRKHDYSHGDIINFEPMKSNPEANHYYYTLIQKSNSVKTDRKEMSNAIAKYDYNTGHYYVTDNILGQSLKKLQDELDEYVLSDQEIIDYNIQEDSIVDLAWYQNNVADTIRVIWRH